MVINYLLHPKIQEIVEPLVCRWIGVAPSWLYRLTVTYDSALESPAQMTVHEDYRQATISIGSTFMDESDHGRIILHELCHLYTVPMSKVGKEVVQKFSNSEEAVDIAFMWINEAMERATEDLAQLLSEVMK